MSQRFPRRARPLVAAAALTFACFGAAAANHVARRGPDLYARLAVIQVIRAPDPKVQESALAWLRKAGPAAVPAIAARAREGPIPDELFAVLAASAGETELDVLAGSVVGMDLGRRQAAVEALARIHSPAAAQAAGPALADPVGGVRAAAQAALRGHGEEILSNAIRQALGQPSFDPEFICGVLVEEGLVAAAVAPIAEGLKSRESLRVYNSIHLARVTFTKFPPGADREAGLAAGITTALPAFQPEAQNLAIELLSALRGPEARAALCDIAGAARMPSAVRQRAIETLAGRRDPAVVAALEGVVRAAGLDLRRSAAEALGSCGTEEDAERWLGLVENHTIGLEAGEALFHSIGDAGSARLLPRLFALVRTGESPAAREALHAILARDPSAGIPPVLDEFATASANSMQWLDLELRQLTCHQTKMSGAWRTVQDFETERAAVLRDWTVWWNLNKGRTPAEWKEGAEREAEDELRSPVAAERAAAVGRLIKLAPGDLEIRLVQVLDDPEAVVWARVQEGLRGKPTLLGNEMLRAKLEAGSARERWRAAQLLGLRLDATAVEGLVKALKSDDSSLQREAARSLGWIGDKAAARPLLPLLRASGSDVREAACGALESLGDRGVEPALLEGLGSSDAEYRLACVSLLGRCGTKASVRPLAKLLRHPDAAIQQAALRSLQGLSGTNPADLEPGEAELRRIEDLVERRQR